MDKGCLIRGSEPNVLGKKAGQGSGSKYQDFVFCIAVLLSVYASLTFGVITAAAQEVGVERRSISYNDRLEQSVRVDFDVRSVNAKIVSPHLKTFFCARD